MIEGKLKRKAVETLAETIIDSMVENGLEVIKIAKRELAKKADAQGMLTMADVEALKLEELIEQELRDYFSKEEKTEGENGM